MTWTGTTGAKHRPLSDHLDFRIPRASLSTADITTLSCLGQQWLRSCSTGPTTSGSSHTGCIFLDSYIDCSSDDPGRWPSLCFCRSYPKRNHCISVFIPWHRSFLRQYIQQRLKCLCAAISFVSRSTSASIV